MNLTESDIARFWSKVGVRGPDECWDWQGAKTSDGYGELQIARAPAYAHRISWVISNGMDVPSGLVVRHSCDRRSCVNPSHLSIGTNADNSRDMMERGRNACTRGSNSVHAVLSKTDVVEIRNLLSSGHTHRAIGERFGVSHRTIESIAQHRNWAWLEEESS